MVYNTNKIDQDPALKSKLLEQSFEKMQPRANAFVDSFFKNLFTDFPKAKSVFSAVSPTQRDNKLLSSVMFVVENAKKEGALDEAIQGIGASHADAEELQEFAPAFRSTFAKTFSQYLGDDWTPEVQAAWGDTYDVLTKVMLDDDESRAALAEVDEATGLKVAMLEQSFEKVKPHANDFVVSFYDNLFTDYPAAKPLFTHTDMGDQGRKLLTSLVFVIENLRKPGELTGALKGLGARHVKYGALPEHYPLVGSSLLKTFEQYLKQDWTPEVKQAWVDAYGLITEVMLDGADYSAHEVALDPAPAAPAAQTPVAAATAEPTTAEEGIKTGPLLGGLIGGGSVLLILLLLLL